MKTLLSSGKIVRISLLFVVAMVTFVGIASAIGVIYRVPGDYSTIQAAINACVDGDQVRVNNGTYTENIDFGGKQIKVFSANGASVTTIDGTQSGPVVTFASSETRSSILQGFTVTNGTGYSSGGSTWGGGIYITGSSPTVKACIIVDNSATNGGGIACINDSFPEISGSQIGTDGNGNTADYGGGIYIEDCDDGQSSTKVLIDDNTPIGYNTANYDGGGVFCEDSNYVIISDNDIRWNTAGSANATGNGGGIYIELCGSGCSIESTNSIYKNTAYGDAQGNDGGGGICLKETHVTITDNYIDENICVDGSGGGIFSAVSDPIIRRNRVHKNKADISGGGLYYDSDYGGNATQIVNTLFNANKVNNTASAVGGAGVFVVDGAPYFNCVTVADNEVLYSGGTGGGFYNLGAYVKLYNCIVYLNKVAGSTQDFYESTANADVQYSDVHGYTGGTGNIDSNPLFAGLVWCLLTSNSPCIDAGNGGLLYSPSDDCQGQSRPYPSGSNYYYDMGWDEYH